MEGLLVRVVLITTEIPLPSNDITATAFISFLSFFTIIAVFKKQNLVEFFSPVH